MVLKSAIRSIRSAFGADGPEPEPPQEPGDPPVEPTARILYYPAIGDGEDFTDPYFRMVWYLHPITERIIEIVVPHEGPAPTIGDMPPYMDDGIREFESAMLPKIRYVPVTDDTTVAKEAEAATLVMLWRITDVRGDWIVDGPAKEIIATKARWRVDPELERHAGSFYLMSSSQFGDNPERDIEESMDKFASIPASTFREKGYIFGTGPTLGTIADMDFSDGTALAINSMVKNVPLMEKLRPPIITAGDPIFHAGCSSYAGEFRGYLRDAMLAFDSYVIVPQRDYRLYLANLDKRLRSRVIGMPMEVAESPNLDLKRSFHVTSTGNIMTLFLLPVACTFFKEIHMSGFDGRPLEENTYFWKHDPSSQLTDRMDDIKLAHPAFFRIDYDDYYQTHCDIVEKWLSAGEHQGIKFVNLTPSYIPALDKRTVGGTG